MADTKIAMKIAETVLYHFAKLYKALYGLPYGIIRIIIRGKHTILIVPIIMIAASILTYLFSLGSLCTLMPMLSNLTLTEVKSYNFKNKHSLKPGTNVLIMSRGE